MLKSVLKFKKVSIVVFFIFFSFPTFGEIVSVSEKHRHLGDYSVNDSCDIALNKAKKKAIVQTLGQTVSSEVVSKCSETDGEYDCERNQLSLFELNGDITSWKELKRDDGKELGSDIRFCEVTIKANVEPIKQNQDPSFHFDVSLNQESFKTGETIEININTSKKMYITIFQWLPYGGKKYNKVTKIFPNKKFNQNTNDLVKDNLNLEYEVYFPEEIKKNKVDEYLVFVASERKIPWLQEYTEIEGLKSQLAKTKVLMEKHYSGYIIIK